jgi:hypothetical protein
MIRWGRLAFLLTPLVLIWAGRIFPGPGHSSAIETAGTAAVGARVDVANVSTSFWRLSADFRPCRHGPGPPHDQSMSRSEPCDFKLQPKPLFWKKFIVDQAEILGIRTGTPEKHRGPCPSGKKKKPVSAITKTRQGTFRRRRKENLKDAYDPKNLVAPENLASYQKAIWPNGTE